MIKVDNISKSYYDKVAIDGISLTVVPGKIQGLVGDNGAGKTTLIKCMAGIYKPAQGTITYCEADVSGALSSTEKQNVATSDQSGVKQECSVYENPSLREKIGYVSDNNEYIGRYTVKKMLKVYETYFPRFDRDKFEKLNQEFKLELGAKIDSLSKGQKMRLGFMLEVAKKPEYLLLDEPTSGLDPVAKKAFFERLVEEVEKENIGVLISSHNLSDLEKLCDTITILDGGKVRSESGLDELKESLTKLQVVFEKGVDEKLLSRDTVLSFSRVGSVYTLIIEDYDSKKEKWLKDLGAGYMEELDMSLEELYIALETRKGES
ncbi:MAG: ABC transporter ATP-binding protein [Lachnospiraceae bacterium]|nr:ABC transporter ATP-binding protein [Lachnospiraceae bacterium]MBQ9936509.1 ABC transporter ATP-binding protein [Lachnospiraceae bacterium]